MALNYDILPGSAFGKKMAVPIIFNRAPWEPLKPLVRLCYDSYNAGFLGGFSPLINNLIMNRRKLQNMPKITLHGNCHGTAPIGLQR